MTAVIVRMLECASRGHRSGSGVLGGVKGEGGFVQESLERSVVRFLAV